MLIYLVLCGHFERPLSIRQFGCAPMQDLKLEISHSLGLTLDGNQLRVKARDLTSALL